MRSAFEAGCQGGYGLQGTATDSGFASRVRRRELDAGNRWSGVFCLEPDRCYRCARMEDASDLELVQCIAGASPDRPSAEAVLCRRFAPRIRLYGLKHLRDPERTRDLVQTVLVAVLQAARERRIDDPARVDRFVLGTCRNTVASMRHQAARVPIVADDVVAELATVPPQTVELNALFACLAKLEARATRVLMLSFLEEYSADEIATKLATAAGNVRVIRHRALGQLRQCLDAGGSPP